MSRQTMDSVAGLQGTPETVPGERRRARGAIPGWLGAAVALVVLMVVTTWFSPAFIRPSNLVSILNNYAAVGIVAVGMTMVIILGGIDLSVGSLLALAGGVGILVLNNIFAAGGGEFLSISGAIATTVGIALAAGLLNGLLVARGGIAPFIATLGALVAFRSAATWIANGGQFFARGPAWFEKLGLGIPIPGTNVSQNPNVVVPLEIPYSVLIWLVVVAVGWVILNQTRFGRYVIAIGSNERAAVYSAIPVARIKTMTYALLGLVTGIAAVVTATRYVSINSANTGTWMELEVIAAVVIGGTRMEGGAGSILGTVLGVILIGVIKNTLVMMGVTSHAHGLVMGVIIIAAALVQRIGPRR